MVVYLIKKDSYETFENVIEWTKDYVLYQAGRGRGKIYAGEEEYFTDVQPTE